MMRLHFCLLTFLLSHPSSGPRLATSYISVLTATFHDDITSSITRQWSIPSSLAIPNQRNISCEVAINAVLRVQIDHEQYWGSGRGSLTCPSCSHRRDATPRMQCIYMTTTGAEVWHQADSPNTLNVAVACTAFTAGESAGNNLCESIRLSRSRKQADGPPLMLTLTLFPSPLAESEHQKLALHHATKHVNRWDPPNLHFLPGTNHSAPTFETVSLSVSAIEPARAAPPSVFQRDDAVCVTQTFRNEQSGPMLYMFVRHYLSLGWVVLVYDRFGSHQEFMLEFAGEERVHYHPYTAYQLLYPDTFTRHFASQQSQSFQYYSERGSRGFGSQEQHKLLRNNEESDHDSDRRKTFLLARQQHRGFFTMLYPDRDEFLVCSQPSTHRENNLSAQKALQRRHFRMLYRRTRAQHILISREAHSALYSLPPDLPASGAGAGTGEVIRAHRDSNMKVDIQERLSACLREGYRSRDMVSLWGCFSAAKVANTKGKSGEILLSESCPFVGVHEGCVRCKCIEARSKKCKYLHLNTVYFKPQKLYEKYGTAIYEPLADLWN